APQMLAVLDVDMTGGIDKPGKVALRHILRGDETYGIRTALAAMSAEDAERAVQTYFRQQAAWIDPDKVDWRFDEKAGAVVLNIAGTGKVDWEGSAEDGMRHDVEGAGFYAPDLRKRPKEQDQAAPWAITYPRFRCWSTTLRLPRPDGAWQWNITGKRVNRALGGVAYWRGIALKDNVLRTVMSSRALTPEISAAEASVANEAIPGFDNKISRIEQDFAIKAPVGRVEPLLAEGDAIDWLASVTPCDGPARGGSAAGGQAGAGDAAN
ncbi:MAG: transglutaminase, partial [Sphingobium sp.]